MGNAVASSTFMLQALKIIRRVGGSRSGTRRDVATSKLFPAFLLSLFMLRLDSWEKIARQDPEKRLELSSNAISCHLAVVCPWNTSRCASGAAPLDPSRCGFHRPLIQLCVNATNSSLRFKNNKNLKYLQLPKKPQLAAKEAQKTPNF